MGDVDARAHIYAAMVLGRDRVASPMLGCLYPPEEIPRYSIYRRLSGPQDQSGHKVVKKNLHPSDTRAIQPVPKRLAAWATWCTSLENIMFYDLLSGVVIKNEVAGHFIHESNTMTTIIIIAIVINYF